MGNLERMSSVLNKIRLQLPPRTTSSNRPPQGNKKNDYCSEPKKSLHVPLRNSFPKHFFSSFFVWFYFFFSDKVLGCQENIYFHSSKEQ